MKEIGIVLSNLCKELRSKICTLFGGDIIEELKVRMDSIAQLRICQLVSSVFCAKNGLLVDVYIPIIVIMQHYQAAHHRPH